MPDLPVSVACNRLDEIVDDARARHEPVFLTRRGRPVEDLADIEAADAARAEIAEHSTIPWDEVKADLRLA